MRSHAKNILAGVGTGAVVILLGVLSIMSFASIDGVKVPASITIIKKVAPQSTHPSDPTEHQDINFRFAINGAGGSTGGLNYSNILDDDGVDTGAGEPLNTWTVNLNIEEGGGNFTIAEEQLTNKYSYNTEIECYYNNDPDKRGHDFGKSTEISLEPKNGHGDITCIFTNTLTDATLNITKDIQPDSSDKVDFDIFTDNDNEHSNGYDYFFLGDNGTHSTKMVSGVNYHVSEYSGARVSSPQFEAKYTTSIVCTSSIPAKSFTLYNQSFFDDYVFDSGETVDCVFTNIKNPEIVVKKVVDPVPNTNDEHFNFKIGRVNQISPAEFSLRNGEETNPAYYIKPSAQYNIEEFLASDQSNKYWVSIHCDYYDANGSKYSEDDKDAKKIGISLGASQKAVCTFTNHLLDVTVKKVVLDKDGTPIDTDSNIFNFTTNLQANPFDLDANPNQAPDSEKKLYFNTTDGIKITENLTSEQKFGYDTSYQCLDHNGIQLKEGTGTKVELTGLTTNNYGITCIFVNKQTEDASVFVHKKFEEEDLDDIAHVRVGPSSDLTKGEEKPIIHDHNQAWQVRPGDITVNEYIIEQLSNNPIKSYLPSYHCVFLAPSTRQPIDAKNTSKIDIPGLKAGERVQCTLTNKEVTAALKIKKDVVASNGKDLTDDTGVFNFRNQKTGDTFKLDDNTNLPDPSEKVLELNPNTNYAFSEISVPSGYTVSYKCVDDKTGAVIDEGNGADTNDFSLDKNQSATCTFTNTKAVATIIIAKDVVGKNDDTNVFKITNNTGVGDFFLDDNANQAPDSTKEITVPAGGTYTFTEDLTPAQALDYTTAWKCTDVNNSGGAGTSFTAPTLGTNESITCTFVNTRINTTITIKKDVKLDDGTDLIDDPEVFKINNSTDFYDLKPLDDNQGDPTYPNQDTIDVTPGKQYFFLEKLQGDQKTNYTPSWECKLGNTVIGTPSGAAILDIPVKKGDNIICVITNVKKTFKQKLTIIKKTKPASTGEVFVFSAPSLSSQVIRINSGSSKEFIVKAGSSHNIKELATNNKYPVTSYSCVYIPTDSKHKTFSGNGKIIPTFIVPKGYDVECTFTNCTSGLVCPLIGDPNDPDPTGGGTNVVGGGGGSGGGNQ